MLDDHKYCFAVSAYLSDFNYRTDYSYTTEVKVGRITPTVAAKKNGNTINVSWSNIYGAQYTLWQSVDGASFTKVSTTAKTSQSVKFVKGHTYQFAVFAYVKENGLQSEFGYSAVVK